MSIILLLLLFACKEESTPQITQRVYVDPNAKAHHIEAVRESSAQKALLTLLRGRHEGRTTEFDGVIRELSRLVCGEEYDLSDIDKMFPPQYIEHAMLASCGGFLLKDGGVVEIVPPRISDGGVPRDE
jgi:hypothetical protein